jgi:hypothetical protein
VFVWCLERVNRQGEGLVAAWRGLGVVLACCGGGGGGGGGVGSGKWCLRSQA